MKAKKRINRHGESAIADMYREYTHLEDMKLMGALDPKILTKSQKRGTLQSIDFIK